MPPIKAEILLTRRCNIRCPHCGIVQRDRRELTGGYWISTIVSLYRMGVKFFPIYGGEPLLYPDLVPLVEGLANHRIPFSIISNGILLTKDFATELFAAGLPSWTTSIDTLDSDRFESPVLRFRNEAGLRSLEIFQEYGIDLQAQATVSPFNLSEIVDLAAHFTSKNIWFSFDLLHSSKTDQKDPDSKVPPDGRLLRDHVPLTRGHMPLINDMVDGLLALKERGARVYQSVKYLNMLRDPVFAIDREWRCSDHGTDPAFLSIDCDGSMLVCDDFSHPSVGKYFADELPGCWSLFVEDWNKVASWCRGCIWSTHVIPFMEPQEAKHVQHKEVM